VIIAFSVLVFLAVLTAGVALFVHQGGETSRRLQKRLGDLNRAGREGPQVDVVRDSTYTSIPWMDEALRRVNLGQQLELLLYQAGMSMRVGVLLLMIVGWGVGGYFLGLLVTHRMAPALLFLGLAAPLPYVYVRIKKHQRMKAFAEEFPDALDLLVSALRAGLSFSAGMQMVSEESPEPVRSEFAVTVEEQSLGLDFRETMVNLTRRVDSLDLRFFVTAIVLQRESGGNLAEILENTSKLIRDRFRILGDIKTFTAQGRLTGMILLALPLSISVFMFVMTPDYFKPMLENQAGRTALMFAGGLQLMGALAIRKIVDIKV
jgi:tight adherence protein B